MSDDSTIADSPVTDAAQSRNPAEHLWMHFTRMSGYATSPVPTIERGEGAYIWDTHGKKYLDALSGLFVVQAGHGRERARRRGGGAGPQARVLPDLVLRAPDGHRAGRPARRGGARRPQQGLLLLRRR